MLSILDRGFEFGEKYLKMDYFYIIMNSVWCGKQVIFAKTVRSKDAVIRSKKRPTYKLQTMTKKKA